MIQSNSNFNPETNISPVGILSADDVVIDPMTTADAPLVKEMIQGGIGAYEEAGTVLASTFRRLENLLQIYDGPGATYVVARDNHSQGAIIGGAGVGPLHGLSPVEGFGEIRDLVVTPEWRGRGVGARLLKRCLDEAKRLGYQRLYLETTPQMEQARKLFIRFGFRPVTTGMPRVGQRESMPCYYILETVS